MGNLVIIDGESVPPKETNAERMKAKQKTGEEKKEKKQKKTKKALKTKKETKKPKDKTRNE